ncbi:MAG: hypothetical protein IIW54_06315 [Lachnospiraceae bacterium]|nr:hypothetical protein [Lachnospiraceae bacterium]
MRKKQKMDLLEIINTLQQMHEEIRKATDCGNDILAQSLLADCQEAAITIGNTIEQLEGEGFVTVRYLEEYCDVLYHINQELSNSDKYRKFYKVLKKHALRIENSIKNDISVRLEIVFLPYKASMWDSLESVWKAADEDEACDAYVIPIPYFDKNPDGSFKQMHYEGNEYPDYVPITSWEKYDLAKRKPDAIFIHNPYDDCNLVTSVHPMFFSRELKKYTEQLVYIPYFVSTNDVSEHFCVLPGTIYADKVILQSEKIRDSYISYFGKWASESGYEKNIPDWKEKFLALGSPKFDKVAATERNDENLPDAWRKKIYREDGTRKKVILYNTSIGALLENHQMLDKIKYTFEVMKANADVVLWWRPHPLYESTLESMRPDLLVEYRKIVEQYMQEDWGIFDDTSDLNRAIVETDAYYGDPSSVVALYESTGKSVMIQSPLILESATEENVKDIPIWTSAFCVDKDDIWFVHGKMNILMKYSMTTRQLEVIGSVPEEKITCEKLYSDIYKYEDSIYLIPCWAEKIAVYLINDNRFQFIEVPYNFQRNKIRYLKSFAYQKYLYCLSATAGIIIKINMDNQNNVSIIPAIESKDQVLHINTAIQISDHIIAGVTGENNIVFWFDLENERISVKKVGKESCIYTSIAYIQNYLFLYDKQEKDIIKCKIVDKIIKYEDKGFIGDVAKIDCFNKELIISQATDKKHIILMDCNLDIVYEKHGEANRNKTLSYDYCHGNVFFNDDSMLTYMDNCDESNIEIWNKENKIEKHNLVFSKVQLNGIRIMVSTENWLECNENEILDLHYFLNTKVVGKEVADNKVNACGVNVYNEIII